MLPSPTQVFAALPSGLRDPLIAEYGLIVHNYMERKWLPAELSGGRFCEIVYTILQGFGSGTYAATPSKPNNFPQACRQLENNSNVPRSFQILIPRMLPPLYEIRNNRGVGHVGGDVDPNHMDANAVLGMVNWIIAELVRVLHQLPIDDAQIVVDQLVERRIPVVWQVGDVKRVLDPTLKLKDQLLLLAMSCPGACSTNDLLNWIEYPNHAYFMKLLRELHRQRWIELSTDELSVQLLPPGSKYVEENLIPSYN